MGTFDSGPPTGWATLFEQAPVAAYTAHPKGRFRTAFGPVFFRGRLDGSARVLVVGQDPSTDETLAQRILVGQAGQLAQALLAKLGLTHSYVMLNTFLFGITRQFDSTMRTISAANPFLAYRNSLFDRVKAENGIQAILAFGAGAQHAVSLWPGRSSLALFPLTHPTAKNGVTASWNTALPLIHNVVPPDAGAPVDLTPFGLELTDADEVGIPRGDLPFGLPSFLGTNGTRSKRQGANTISWTAP